MYNLRLPALLACLLLLAGCGSVQPPAPVYAITGSVDFATRRSLPASALLEVEFLDLSRPDAPARVLQTVTIGPAVRLPSYFRIDYNPAQVSPTGTYALQARVTINGTLRFISKGGTKVLTGGNPTHRDLILEPAGGS